MEREVSENSRVMVSDRVATMLGFGMGGQGRCLLGGSMECGEAVTGGFCKFPTTFLEDHPS